MSKLLTEQSLREWSEEMRHQSHKFCLKYEKMFDEPKSKITPEQFKIKVQFYRSLQNIYGNIYELTQHLLRHKSSYSPSQCLSCRFDDGKHRERLKISLKKYAPYIAKTIDGKTYLKEKIQ